MISIRAERLGKCYRSKSRSHQRALRQVIADAMLSPFRLVGGRRPSTDNEDLPRDFWAIRDVSFELSSGDVLGVVGRNGAGKSTLLRLLSFITEPTSGFAEIHGRVGALLEVGTGFHPELTGRDNIFLSGAILGMRRTEIASKLDEIIAFSETGRFVDTPVKFYSSGMYMRLAFAVAAHLEPDILLVDEVLAVGDAAFQKKCLGRMGEVAGSGRTVVFISHNASAVERLCNKVLLLEGGTAAAFGTDVSGLMRRYTVQSEGDGPVTEWINTGDQHSSPGFTPRSMCLTARDGTRLQMPIQNTEETFLQIQARVDALDPGLVIGYALYTEEGTLLYWSYHTDLEETHWPRVPEKSDFVLRAQLPRRLLNEGTYRVELVVALHFRDFLIHPGSGPAVFLSVLGGLSDSPHWMARRPGILAPVLEWSLVR